MRNLITACLVLAVSGVIGACTRPEVVTLPLVALRDPFAPFTPEEQLERRRNLRPHRETLLVFHEHHYGYAFNRASDLNTPIFAEIPDQALAQTFHRFFSTENLGQYLGKRIYCDCAGEIYDVHGVEFLIVHEARLFAE